jgi:hypothetical protein
MSAAVEPALLRYQADWDAEIASRVLAADAIQTEGVPGKQVFMLDPPYNTGNKDWVYNDHYVGANDRWRHSQWLEFLYRRLTLAGGSDA